MRRFLAKIFIGVILLLVLFVSVIYHSVRLSSGSTLIEYSNFLRNSSTLAKINDHVTSHKKEQTRMDREIEVFNSFKYSKDNTTEGDSSDTYIDDIFIGIKSTTKFHSSRLDLLLKTWIPQAISSVRTLYYV